VTAHTAARKNAQAGRPCENNHRSLIDPCPMLVPHDRNFVRAIAERSKRLLVLSCIGLASLAGCGGGGGDDDGGAYTPESNTTLAIYVEALQALAHDVTQWMQRAATHTGA
jgi:hypothetical protein